MAAPRVTLWVSGNTTYATVTRNGRTIAEGAVNSVLAQLDDRGERAAAGALRDAYWDHLAELRAQKAAP